MNELLSLKSLLDLGMLIFLQAVLGFDNLLYISIESKRAPKESQKSVRKWGILIAIGLRILLLFVIMSLLKNLTQNFFTLHFPGIIEGEFSFAVLVFLFGGAFIMYTALKEISHLLATPELEGASQAQKKQKSAWEVTVLIIFMNLIFSFDSILSAIAISKVFVVLALAILISGISMLLLADDVAEFIEKNRMYEVLGLFVLLIVGIVLLGEGGHKAHLKLFDYPVEPLPKTTFYFSIAVLFIVEFLQSSYQKKLNLKKRTSKKKA